MNQFSRCSALALTLMGTANAAVAKAGDGFDVESFQVFLKPDLQQKTITGREQIRLRVTAEALQELVFTRNPMQVESATAQGRAVTVASQADGVHFRLPAPLRRGQRLQVDIAYSGAPKQGIVFQRESMYTSYFACEWMFCAEDAPGDKARFDLSLVVPAGLSSLAVGRRVSISKQADGLEVHRWRTSLPYSVYLFDFAIGRFTTVSVPVPNEQQLKYAGEGVSAPELQRTFAQTPAMLAFLQQKAGAPLPSLTYTELLVPGDEAQEAATYSILGQDSLDPDDDWATIHELAHQWWGNWVTCRTWQDFWLNESFAVYLTAVWKQHAHGQAGYDQEMENARKRVAKLQAEGWDRPLAWSGQYPKLWMRRSVQYSKGALFLEKLHSELGDTVFWTGVREYTRRNGGRTVVSADFQKAMEKASGKDLQPLFREWVYGDPVVAVVP